MQPYLICPPSCPRRLSSIKCLLLGVRSLTMRSQHARRPTGLPVTMSAPYPRGPLCVYGVHVPLAHLFKAFRRRDAAARCAGQGNVVHRVVGPKFQVPLEAKSMPDVKAKVMPG